MLRHGATRGLPRSARAFSHASLVWARAPSTSKTPRPRPPGTLRQFLEVRGLLSTAPAPNEGERERKAASVSAPTLRRTRLPMAKAKALALESRALREQVASQHDATEVPAPVPADPMDLPEVIAVATARSYNFDALLRSQRLPPHWVWLEDREVIYVPAWPEQGDALGMGSAFIFRSGCYVTWGMSPEQKAALYRDVIRGGTEPVECLRYGVAGDEAMEFVHLPDEPTRVVGDLIVVGQPSREWTNRARSDTATLLLQARLAISQGLAASARLSVQEAVLAEYLRSVSLMPEQLEQNGKVPLPRRALIRKMGTLLRLRQHLNLDHDNFLDDPELYWDNSHMEALYRHTCEALDIKPRIESLNAKLNHCEHLLEVLRALLTEESSHRMELIIIYLIAFEVGMALVSHEYVPTPLAVWRWGQSFLAS
ncbi:hypothetical protein MNAN1_002034 [Malassezia nana]|uniref:DUF155 domain-containing protein n=1 Tax=Malassezia nana TaxID=180528 RepID=A0AAF0J7G5_9BASI|nr:hypothetical protein MNAN1_002034 [Malassezia nana]